MFALIIIAISTTLVLQSTGNTVIAQNNSNNISNQSNINSISIPLSKGYVNGNISYFISTDASEKQIVSSIANTTKFVVNYAPSLANTSESARQQGYVFINGVKGNGPDDSQIPVASAIPNNAADNNGYSPLFQINYVKWNSDSHPRILKSVSEILEAQNKGELTIAKTNIVINSPFVQFK